VSKLIILRWQSLAGNLLNLLFMNWEHDKHPTRGKQPFEKSILRIYRFVYNFYISPSTYSNCKHFCDLVKAQFHGSVPSTF